MKFERLVLKGGKVLIDFRVCSDYKCKKLDISDHEGVKIMGSHTPLKNKGMSLVKQTRLSSVLDWGR